MIARLSDPENMKRFNAAATVFWLLAGIPTVLIWKESILWLAIMSLWANVASHMAGWLAARVEVKQDESGTA